MRGLHRLNHNFRQFFKVERRLLGLRLVRIELGEIQDVTDETQEVLRGMLNKFGQSKAAAATRALR